MEGQLAEATCKLGNAIWAGLCIEGHPLCRQSTAPGNPVCATSGCTKKLCCLCLTTTPWITSIGNHDSSGDDTICDATIRGVNEEVVSHTCKNAQPKDKHCQPDASGDFTACDATICGTNEDRATRADDHHCGQQQQPRRQHRQPWCFCK